MGFRSPDTPEHIVAGIVPHAGWFFSGRLAAKVFKCLKEKNQVDTFILLGAIHSFPERNSLFSSGSWATPFGALEADEGIASILLEAVGEDLIEDPEAHAGEHSLEVQTPFIKYFFPAAKIVPIRVNPDNKAARLGRKIGEVVAKSKKNIAVIGTTDLTHYGDDYGFAPSGGGKGALEWMKDNDQRIVKLAIDMRSEAIVEEAMMHHNACGSGALAATIAAAEVLGAKKGVLLGYTTSFEVSPDPEFFRAVGYAGIVF